MKHTLESTVSAHLESVFPDAFDPASPLVFNVVAFELWRDHIGWTCNDSWRIAHAVTAEGVLEAARGRWEVFKANYFSRARVRDIKDNGFDERISLEVDGLPFLEIYLAE